MNARQRPTAIDLVAILTDALDCLDRWDELLEVLYEVGPELGVDGNRVGRQMCMLDTVAHSTLRQVEARIGVRS